jgi:Ca2+-binding RTX toxin-like protein
MAGSTADVIGDVLYSALSENVYRRNTLLDQGLALNEIRLDGSLLVDSSYTAGPNFIGNWGLNLAYDPQGYIYSTGGNTSGFGALVVQDMLTGKWVITFRGTDSTVNGWTAGLANLTNWSSPTPPSGPTLFGGPGKLDYGDGYTGGALGFGTTSVTQWDAAKKLVAQVIADHGAANVVVTGQSLGGGLAALASAYFGVEGHAFAPGPVGNQIAIEEGRVAAASVVANLSSLFTATFLSLSIDLQAQNLANHFVTMGSTSILVNPTPANIALVNSQWDSTLLFEQNRFGANISNKLHVTSLLGETLSSNSFLGKLTQIVPQVKSADQVIDVGVANDEGLHSPALHALVIRTEIYNGGQQKFSTLLKNDENLRYAFAGEPGVVTPVQSNIAGVVDHARTGPAADASTLLPSGPNSYLLENLLWKGVSQGSHGLYDYFYTIFNEKLTTGAAAQGLQASGAPIDLHSGLVRLIISVLRDATTNQNVIDNVKTALGGKWEFAGASADGVAYNDKVIVDKTRITSTDPLHKDPLGLEYWGIRDVELAAYKAAYDVLKSYVGVSAASSILDPIILEALIPGQQTNLKLNWKVIAAQAGSEAGFEYDPAALNPTTLQDGTALNNAEQLVFGGKGDDKITGSQKDDFLIGGDGKDWIEGKNGKDIIVGGIGTAIDTASYTNSTSAVTINFNAAQSEERKAAILRVTDDGFGTEDVLIGIERIELTKLADTISFNSQMQTAVKELPQGLILDGGDQPAGATTNATLGDVLDFRSATGQVILKNALDGSNTVEMYSKDGAVTSATGFKFANFEYVKGSASSDILNLSKLFPGGEPSTVVPPPVNGVVQQSDQQKSDAAWAAFHTALAPPSVPRSVYDAAYNTLVTALSTLKPYQQHLQIDGGAGGDIIIGADVGVSDIYGGDGDDYLFSGQYGSNIYGGNGKDRLISDGVDSHLTGGAGNDLFILSNRATVTDASKQGDQDYAAWGGLVLTGGVLLAA